MGAVCQCSNSDAEAADAKRDVHCEAHCVLGDDQLEHQSKGYTHAGSREGEESAQHVGKQSLQEAVKDCNELLLKEYLEQGSDPQAVHDILFEACTQANTCTIKFLAKCGVVLNAIGPSGMTALQMVASELGHIGTVDVLLENKADAEAMGDVACTPLVLALAAGHESVATRLLGCGVSTQVFDHEGRSPLALALENRQLGVAKLLTSADVTAAEADCLNQALLAACTTDDWPLAQELVALGAKSGPKRGGLRNLQCQSATDHAEEVGTPASPARSGRTTAASSSLVLAVDKGQVELAKALLQSASKDEKAELNEKLRQALLRNKVDAARVYFACGISPDVRDSAGRTPLIRAVAGGNETTAKFLLENGAKKDAKGSKDGKSPLDVAVEKGSPILVRLLLGHGVKPPPAFRDGLKVLEAAERGEDTRLEILLACRADVQRQDDTNETPLHKAAKSGHAKVVQLLLDMRAEIDAKGGEYDCSPLYAAAKEDKIATFKLLLERGADKEARQKDDRPVLGQAARTGNKEMVILLLDRRADIQGSDCDRDTPLHIVAMNAMFDIATLLVEKKADTKAKNSKGKSPLSVAAGAHDWRSLLGMPARA